MNNERPKWCQVRYSNGSLHCDRCGLTWDYNDPEPPTCLTKEELNKLHGRETFKKLKRMLNDEQ